MYIDRFINNKYIALLSYCININKNNSIIVDLKYVSRNKVMFLRSVGKKLDLNSINLFNFLLQLRKKDRITASANKLIYSYKKKLKAGLRLFLHKLSRKRISLKLKEFRKSKLIKILNIKLRKFKKKIYRNIQCRFRYYNFINANTNLHKFFKKIKLLRFIVHKLLHYQVLGNSLLLDVFLNLNLHPLFFKRFKFHFLLFIRNAKEVKKKFNFNNFNLFLFSKVYPKLVKFSNLLFSLGILRKTSWLFTSLYTKVAKQLVTLLTLGFDLKYLNKYKNYMSNLSYVNYINVSFKLTISRKLHKRKFRRYYKKFKKFNFLNFFNLAFKKLVAFLFVY